MLRFWRRTAEGEEGQVLPLVLALLALGGLTVTSALDYAATSLNHCRTIDRGMNGIYAADAGVEYALWCLENSVSPPQQLSESINQANVAIQTEEIGTYTLCFGDLVQAGKHSYYISASGEIVWDAEAQAYKYTITVTREGGATVIHLTEVGARLPAGYSYQSGSASGFPENLSLAEPEELIDSYGAQMLKWQFESPYPSVSGSDPERTQIFYVTGEGDLNGDYTWVVANREDVGGVGEITGTIYRITAMATQPGNGETTGKIVAEVMMDEGAAQIVLWQVSN